ncbi:MAG: MarR family transcriptional regulator [Pseudomonadota bacterium]
MDCVLDHDAALALQIDRLMRRFHTDLHPRAQKIDAEKIGPIGGMILFVMSEQGPLTAQAIADTLSRDKSQISRVMSLLMRKGLVDRTTDREDARSATLHLSEKGKMQVAAFNGALVETAKSVLGPLSASEVQTFSGLMTKILSSDR